MPPTNRSEDAIAAYVKEGEQNARALDNRGPIQFDDSGTLDQRILHAFWHYGFYVLEGVLGDEELNDLQTDLDGVFERAPYKKDASIDAKGRPAVGSGLEKSPFRFTKPLSDPNGGTTNANGRYQVKMSEPEAPSNAPEHVISNISHPLQIMDSFLRLYGHPQLLAIAEQINGPDFTPFTESVIVKRAKLGSSIAWHQDGTRRWDLPDWDQGTHGFNFMAQLYGSTAANGVWVIPGSHKRGKIDIKVMKASNNGSDQLPGAVPIVCEPGDVVMANRQALHASFANTSPHKRMTFNFGFHRRSSVLGMQIGKTERYDDARIHERSRVIALAIDARQQRFPDEARYIYRPLLGQEDENRWNEETRESILKNYNLRDLGI